MNHVDTTGQPHGTGVSRATRSRAGIATTLLAGLLAFAPSGATAAEFWVDAATGNDARSPIQAQSKATPWKTIVHALETVTSGHSIRVRPGTYTERLESGAPGVYTEPWQGIWAPKGTPREIVLKLNEAVRAALADEANRKKFADQSYELTPRENLSTEYFAQFIKADIEKWWPIIKAAGIKAGG